MHENKCHRKTYLRCKVTDVWEMEVTMHSKERSGSLEVKNYFMDLINSNVGQKGSDN